jgi:hypothetical protein
VLGLLDSGADANAALPDKQRPLHLAARAGRFKCVPLLVDAGADVNARDRKGATPLHAAVGASAHCQVSRATSLASLLASWPPSCLVASLLPRGLPPTSWPLRSLSPLAFSIDR